jgi:glucuronoarabinoxylan endo-1,4-beta-xylanase
MTAFKEDSRFVIVLVNAGSSIQQPIRVENLSIPVGSGVTVTPYVTSPTKSFVQGSPIIASGGNFTVSLDSSSITTLVGDVVSDVGQEEQLLPRTVELGQNYPNPFNPSTVIRFALPSASQVSLTVFDVLGREVSSLVRGELQAGEHTAEWAPQAASSGLYFYRLVVDDIGNTSMRSMKTRSMLLLR